MNKLVLLSIAIGFATTANAGITLPDANTQATINIEEATGNSVKALTGHVGFSSGVDKDVGLIGVNKSGGVFTEKVPAAAMSYDQLMDLKNKALRGDAEIPCEPGEVCIETPPAQ